MAESLDSIPAVGKNAPAFKLESDDGSMISAAGLKGKPYVLYFYPKDDTSGCTVEALEFRDFLPEFEQLGVTVLGISPDSIKSHCKFRDKHALNFRLLSDPGSTVCTKFGVWQEKSMYGRKYMGVLRSTFLVDAKGKIAQVWTKVTPKGHAAEVLAAARAL